MAKRRKPPERRVWARLVDREWRVTLVDGEVLRPVGPLSPAEARTASTQVRTFLIGFLMPVVDLTGDDRAIRAATSLTATDDSGAEWNSCARFRGDRGTEAVVIEHHH